VLLAQIITIGNFSPTDSATLSKMYLGIQSQMRDLYDSHRNRFVQAVNNMPQVDKTAFKGSLENMGINC